MAALCVCVYVHGFTYARRVHVFSCECADESVGRVQAISQPTKESEAAAWDSVLPVVNTLKNCYEFSAKLGTCLSCVFCVQSAS